MRFGVCCGLDEARGVLDAGFDYVELGAVGFNGLFDEWDPTPYQGLPVDATNLFFPGQLRLIGPDKTEYLPYARRTIERAASLGVKVMVIGSGGSRRAPDGVDGDEEFVRICGEIAEIARTYGITIAPESLNRSETNVGNDLGSLARGLYQRGAGYTADSYHLLYEWDRDGRKQPLDELLSDRIPHRPDHVHMASLEGRAAPKPGDPMVESFIGRLRELNYVGRISLECARPDGFDFGLTLANLRKLVSW